MLNRPASFFAPRRQQGEKENPLARNKGDTLIVRNRSMALS
jgi:hypothetical protein